MNFECNNQIRKYFYEITQIPHGSKNEKALSDYVVSIAKKHGLRYRQDQLGNVVVYKEASDGYQDYPPVGLQGHMDMVNEKNMDCDHDFDTDPLDLYVDENNWLHARGTTLGADDGTAIAYMLAILTDNSLSHPALECIFTVQEEIGLIGAIGLDKSWVSAHRLISMDGGGEYCTATSSAGGYRVVLEKQLEKESGSFKGYHLAIRGLQGGHSGGEIHLERGNGNKLMARILKELQLNGIQYQLVSYKGGMKENAIARECDATIVTDAKQSDVLNSITGSEKAIWTELEFSDNGFKVEIEQVECEYRYSLNDTINVVDMLFMLPNGFVAKSLALNGLTMTSLNMGVVHISDNQLFVGLSLRSMLNSAIDHLYNQISLIGQLYGATIKSGARYPGWRYNPNSKLRELFRETLKNYYGKDLIEAATHGGLECGVFADYYPDMDLINIGPIHKDIHSPKECLDLDSFDRSYQILIKLLEGCR